MKAMRLPIFAGSLLLAASFALFAEAQLVTSPHQDQSTTSPLTPTRNEYMRAALNRYNEWAQRMADLQMRILQNRITMSGEAKTNVETAWNDLKLRWAQLERANDQDWVGARNSWETASDRMKGAWEKSVSR